MSEFLFTSAIYDIVYNLNGNVANDTNFSSRKTLLKFGRNDSVGGTPATLMTLNGTETSETYATSNTIDTLSSTSASDTTQVTVEGHTVDGNGDFTFIVQTATLTGQTKVTLGTPLARITRLYNSGSTDFIGRIFGYQDTAIVAGEPTDDTKIHCIVIAGYNQSQKASTTVSSTQWWLINNVYADVLEKATAFGSVVLEIREKGKVFRQVFEMAANTGSRAEHSFDPYLIVKPNSDVRLTAVSGGAAVDISGGIQGLLISTKGT